MYRNYTKLHDKLKNLTRIILFKSTYFSRVSQKEIESSHETTKMKKMSPYFYLCT